MKKFYQSVSIENYTARNFRILLDGKPVLTPARHPLSVSTPKLAELVREEWESQGQDINPLNMPVCQFAMTLTDRIIPTRKKSELEILDYIDTDLVCYRAREPEHYKTAQENKWDPFVTWFQKKFGYPLLTTNDLNPIEQSEAIHQTLKTLIESLDNNTFMVLYFTTLGTGSLVLGLAYISQEFSADDILAAAFVEELLKDEIYMASFYGSAPEQEKKYRSLKSDLIALAPFLKD